MTDTHHVATDTIEKVRVIEHSGKTLVEMEHKRKDFVACHIGGEDAAEAWANWQA